MSPTKLYEYTVRGTGTFPIDMLRYDKGSPRSESDSSLIESTFHPRNTALHDVRISGTRAPTIGRWESFGWKIVQQDVRKV